MRLAQAAACFCIIYFVLKPFTICVCIKYFGCFKIERKKLRLNRKRDYVLAEVLLAFRHYMGYTLHRIQGKDDDHVSARGEENYDAR